MSFRLIGAAMIMFSSVMFGRMKISEERKKRALILGITDFVRGIRDHISHFRRPLAEIYNSLSIPALEPCGFIDQCRKNGIHTAWERISPMIPAESFAVMEEFVRRIGSGYREDELELCAYTIRRLESIGELASAELKKSEKLYRNLPPLAALSAVLLVL